MMKRSFRVGFSFGLTSGIIGTLGLMVGLNASSSSKLVVIGGILAVAIAEGFSESVGIHIAEEFENRHTEREVWESTFSTFICKFIFSSIFIIPVLLFELSIAIIVSVMVGLYVLFLVSLIIARERNAKPWKIIMKHMIIAVLVIFMTHYTGLWLASIFG